jgi:hypothetical protein
MVAVKIEIQSSDKGIRTHRFLSVIYIYYQHKDMLVFADFTYFPASPNEECLA